ncbi:MAG: endonuclease/exonuclease/phosphatase family protein [Gemmatimonadota bacterium]|nr:endonuclease/exonuclease/phosphatase family protein [Gemmatimonadota bacterium]
MTPSDRPSGERAKPAAPLPGLAAGFPTFELADEAEHQTLSRWRANVGTPVALDLAAPGPAEVHGIDLLSWNVAAGRARVGELIARLRGGAFGGAGNDPARPFVLLLQEAYRADESIPARAVGPHHGGNVAPRTPLDVVDLARSHFLSLRYAPSMRNGATRSDRGNAILSTVPLERAHAFSLLYINQRRVAVAGELHGVGGVALVSAHLDTGRRWGMADSAARIPGRARAEQAERLVRAILRVDAPGGVVLAGDFNTPLGRRDPAYRALIRGGLQSATRSGRWDHTHHHLLRLDLDHVLVHPFGRLASVGVERIDEDQGDRGSTIFGSDHHPLLARISLTPESSA